MDCSAARIAACIARLGGGPGELGGGGADDREGDLILGSIVGGLGGAAGGVGAEDMGGGGAELGIGGAEEGGSGGGDGCGGIGVGGFDGDGKSSSVRDGL